MASEPRNSDPFQPNSLAGPPDWATDPHATNALDAYGYGAPDPRADAPNALAVPVSRQSEERASFGSTLPSRLHAKRR